MDKGPINFPVIEGPSEKQLNKIKMRFSRLPRWARDYITYLESQNTQLKEQLTRYTDAFELVIL